MNLRIGAITTGACPVSHVRVLGWDQRSPPRGLETSKKMDTLVQSMFKSASSLGFTIAAATSITGSHDRRKTMDDHLSRHSARGFVVEAMPSPVYKRSDWILSAEVTRHSEL